MTAYVTDAFGDPVPDGTNVNFSVIGGGAANPVDVLTSAGAAASTITPLAGTVSGVTVVATSGSAQVSINVECLDPDNSWQPFEIFWLPFIDARSTAGATLEPGEPRPCGNIDATVWYHFSLVPSPPGSVALTADTAGSDFNTAIAVYTSINFASSPPGGVTLVDCTTNGAASPLNFMAVSGSDYYIQVGGANGATGNLVFDLNCTGDTDCDFIADGSDNCPTAYNPDQLNTDGDGVGNMCDPDNDNDGCNDEYEIANQGLGKKPDSPLDATDFPDADGSGKVEYGDFLLLLGAWNRTPASGTPPYDPRVNFDKTNDKIEYGDFLVLLSGWNRRCVH